MDRYLNLAKSKKLSLIVALPENDLDMAQAAEAAGADAVKTHLRLTHRASKHVFGSLDEECARLDAILHTLQIPVGLVPGAQDVRRDEVERAAQMGFDFMDMFVHFMPPWLLSLPGFTKVAAADSSCTFEFMRSVRNLPIDMFEVAIIHPDGYGKPLCVSDLANYRLAVQALDKPCILPTQRSITVQDLPYLVETGIKAVMIGVLFTGSTPQMIEARTAEFRRALDRLP